MQIRGDMKIEGKIISKKCVYEIKMGKTTYSVTEKQLIQLRNEINDMIPSPY